MLFGFMRHKTPAGETADTQNAIKMLDQTWDLSGVTPMVEAGLNNRAKKIIDLIFQKLNQTMTAILKSVTALACLGPDLFEISRAFKSKSRVQNKKINEISSAGTRISKGVQEIFTHTQSLTLDFGGIQEEVSTALEKGDQSMEGFKEIKAQVADLVEIIQDLKENSDSIGSIIDVINTISDETNILSLNARIEAARESDNGKGFKVIAEEVGNLARQSKDATRDIQDRLTHLGDRISNTVEGVGRVEHNVIACEHCIDEANTALNHVCGRFGALSKSLNEINESAGRQTADVRQVAQNIMEIESALGDQVRDADIIFQIAEQVNAACDQMIVDTGVFHLSGHQKARQTAQAMAKDPRLVSGAGADREKALVRCLEKEHFIELAYITDGAGRQITSNIYCAKLAGTEGLEKGLDRDWSSKEWFLAPARTRNAFISKVYRSSATGSFCFTVAVPLGDAQGFSGVLGIDINFKDMLDI